MAGMAYPGYTPPTTPLKSSPQKKYEQQLPYEGAAPSAGSVTDAFKQIQGIKDIGYGIDPTGRVSINNQEQQARLTDAQQARFAAEEAERARQADAAKRDSFLGLLRTEESAPKPGMITHPGMTGGQDARAAAFARAKDQAGRIARSALTSISENMAGRGISGSGIDALRSAGSIQSAANPLFDLNTEQMLTDENRAANIADMSYQGDITQRGQDLANRQSFLSLLRSLY